MLSDRLLYYWLSLCRITPVRAMKLLEIYSVSELFARVRKDERIAALVGSDQYAKLCRMADEALLQKSYEEMYRYNVNFLAFCDSEFPLKLRQCEVAPPQGLYVWGDVSLLKTPAIGIVGTRRCSAYGKDAAFRFGAELPDYHFTVVSGLATGIDAYAHEACLKAGGKTIAVLGMGHARFAPKDNMKLFERICAEGLVVSEYPPTFEGSKYTFPERNRIIAALSDGVIVVEAASKSGALITADRALEQGKEIFAVPGNITSPKSAGTNALIQNGATLLSGMQDILKHFSGRNTKILQKSHALQLDIFEQKIYNQLESGEMSVDELHLKTEMTVAELLALLLSMEMKGAITRGFSANTYRIMR